MVDYYCIRKLPQTISFDLRPILSFWYKNSSCHSRLGYPLPQSCRNWPECGYHTQHDTSHVPYDLFQHHWCQGLWFRHLAFYLHYFWYYQMSRSYVTCQVSSYFRHQISTNCVYKPLRCRFLDHSCPLWNKACFGVIQVNMSLISGANTNVAIQIQVHVHLTGKCLLVYIKVVLRYMETVLHTICCQGKCKCFFIPTLYNLLFLCSLCTGDKY